MTIRSGISGKPGSEKRWCSTFGIFIFSMAVLLLFIAIPVNAEEFPVIETVYTYVDGDDDVHFPYVPSDDKTSHAGLSNGEVAYSKSGDPLVYIWDSVTGETKTFDTTELAEKKITGSRSGWISGLLISPMASSIILLQYTLRLLRGRRHPAGVCSILTE